MYGLLLPETATSVQKKEPSKPAADGTVQLRHTAGDKGAVMRHTKKMRNRKSAVYGESDEANSNNTETAATASDKAKSPVHDMNVKFVSFSPENSMDKGDDSSDGVLETRQGKVSDLVKQFEEEEMAKELQKQNNSSENAVAVQNGESGEKDNGNKRRPSSKAFDLFEKSGIIMGMVSFRSGWPQFENLIIVQQCQYNRLNFASVLQGGPSSHSKPRAVSFAKEVSTIPADPSSSSPSSMSHLTEDNRTLSSPRATLTTLGSTIAGSEDLTTVSKDFLSVSTCDEVLIL